MNLLLHTCCAPCSVACVSRLREEGIHPTAFWYNPNIHPLKEYRARKQTLIEYAASIHMKVIMEDVYGLRKFIQGIYPDFDHRCDFCYRVRLEETAARAKERGFEAFSTTLLISPYQKHEWIRKLGEEIGEKYGIPFLYRDFRPYFREGQDQARALGLYMQKYCGCVFSEEERYAKKRKGEINNGT